MKDRFPRPGRALPAPAALACATWNIHRARGADGRVDPGRVAAAIGGEAALAGADVLALQEADTECPPHSGLLDLGRIEQATGLRSIHTSPGLRWGGQSHGFLGSILFLRSGLSVLRAGVIDLPGHCHRGAVVADVAGAGGTAFRIVTAHLSLGQPLRIVQMRTIGQHLSRQEAMPTILMGDLNEWRPWGGLALSRAVVGRRFAGPWRATFPARAPFLPLDRILCDTPGAVRDLRVPDSPALRAASDHLPLAARVVLSG